MSVPVQGIVDSSLGILGSRSNVGVSHEDAPWKQRAIQIDFAAKRGPAEGRISNPQDALSILAATNAARGENRVTPFTAMGHAREVTLQDMIRAARSTAQDPAKAFPDASEEEQNEIAMLQEQNLELMERLRATRRMHVLAERNDEDLHEDRGLPEPRRKLRDGQWTVEGWGLDAEKRDVVDVHIEGRERVHIRQCSGLGHPVLIRMHGIANQLCVEECSNVQIETDGVLNSIAVSQCSKVTLLVGAECPATLLKHVRGCDITLCPDNMDGAIDTVGCSSVRIHSIFRRGVLSLGPEDLKSAVASYNATIPVRFSSRMAEGEWITDARDGGELRGQVEVWWDSRAREILAEDDDA